MTMPIPQPGDPSVLLTAFQGDLRAAGIARPPGIALAGAVPLWLEPPDAVAPGDKRGTVEDDPRCVLSAFLQAGPSGGSFDRWHRYHIIDLRIRTLGNGGPRIASDIENRIRRHLLGDSTVPAVNFDLGWTDGAGSHRLRVIEASLNTELQRIGSNPAGPSWTHRVEYLFELYADVAAITE